MTIYFDEVGRVPDELWTGMSILVDDERFTVVSIGPNEITMARPITVDDRRRGDWLAVPHGDAPDAGPGEIGQMELMDRARLTPSDQGSPTLDEGLERSFREAGDFFREDEKDALRG